MNQSDIYQDYFALMPFLKERLASELSDITSTQILSGYDLASAAQGTIQYPCLFVVYLQDDAITTAGYHTNELVQQRWQVIVATRNVTNPRESGDIMNEAGQLVSRVIHALRGWVPFVGASPLKRVTAERAIYPAAGLAFFPVEFTIYFEDSELGD